MPNTQIGGIKTWLAAGLVVWVATLLSGCGGSGSKVSSSSASLLSQSISFSAAPALALNKAVTVSATATSGLAVTYSSTTPSVCTVSSSGGRVTDLTAGTCIIAANQAGNDEYAAAEQVVQSIAVGVATYGVTEVFKEPNTSPNNTIFTGVFTYDSSTQAITNLYGSLTESMNQEATVSASEMSAVALSYQLSSISDGDGGVLVTTYALDTTNVFDSGSTDYYGHSSGATNPSHGGTGNAYATMDVDLRIL